VVQGKRTKKIIMDIVGKETLLSRAPPGKGGSSTKMEGVSFRGRPGKIKYQSARSITAHYGRTLRAGKKGGVREEEKNIDF